MPFPFLNDTTGTLCCTSKIHPCPRCLAKLAAEATAQRTLQALRAAHDFAPPDPYAPGVQRLRDDDARAAQAVPVRRPIVDLPLDAHGVPDPYALDIARYREELT